MKRLVLAGALLSAACGGGYGSPSPTPTPTVTETANYTGTTRSTSATSCTGDSHAFTAADGAISVTLVSTSTNENLTAQICPPNSLTCTLTRRQINIGQTIESTRQGGESQVLSFLPLNCGTGAPPSPDPITYTARVTYRR
jgi:hypothetical protein